MTQGHKTSERKACYHAVYISLFVALLGIWKGADLDSLAVLVCAVNAPLMWYAGNRSYLKARIGKE